MESWKAKSGGMEVFMIVGLIKIPVESYHPGAIGNTLFMMYCDIMRSKTLLISEGSKIFYI